MCSYIGFKINNLQIKNYEINELIDYTLSILNDKGGDGYSIKIFKTATKSIIDITALNEEVFKDTVSEEFKKLNFGDIVIGFSRQKPEMEKEIIAKELPPYETLFGNYILAHGTIPLKNLKVDIVDTEIFKFFENITECLKKTELLNGKISILEFDKKNGNLSCGHNGLGAIKFNYNGNVAIGFHNRIISSEPYLVQLGFEEKDIEPNTIATTTWSDLEDNNLKIKKINNDKPEIIVSLCSGGLDATLSTLKIINDKYIDDKNIKVIITYFDWGTMAKEQEILACEKIRNELSLNYTEFDIYFDKIDAKQYFKEILGFAQLNSTRLLDPEAKEEGLNETKEAISYVPLRNTFLILALVAKYESLYPNYNITFVFGGNLTEGMVYSDNSVNFTEKLNQLIKLSGQKTSNFTLVAPFAKKTKTKMVEYFLNHSSEKLKKLAKNLINISYSCYFPKENGDACGKCGSCILRDHVI